MQKIIFGFAALALAAAGSLAPAHAQMSGVVSMDHNYRGSSYYAGNHDSYEGYRDHGSYGGNGGYRSSYGGYGDYHEGYDPSHDRRR